MPTLLGRGRSEVETQSPYPRPLAARPGGRLARPGGRFALPGGRLARPGVVKTLAALALTTVSALVVVVGRCMYTRLQIEGLSMVPELAPGDRVVVRKTHQVAVGDVVALRDPVEPDRYLVKRVVALEHRALRVEGDNAGASRDSRHFGPVPLSLVIGRVVGRYHTARRSLPGS
ncbi:MAG: nickel-type superoxide dismutase maturation protease, partial [Actinomycetota bacterium]|nr:nickel-type superoxide dismutase maturation protease [Actinomycetota bacterium]